MENKDSRKGRQILLVLVAIFFAPLLLAWLIYLGVIDWKPAASAANGELIQPPVSLPDHLPSYTVKIYDDEYLRRRWTLVYIVPPLCESDCEHALLIMRQVRMALGKYADRIGRLMIVPNREMVTDRISGAFPGMEIVLTDALSEQILESTKAQPGEWIYVIDPLGNVMMRFPKDQEPRPMHDDLKRLLKLSRIG